MAGTASRGRSGRSAPRSRRCSLQSLRNPIGDAQGVGDDGQRRVDRADRRKEAGIGEIEVVELVRLAVEVEHRVSRIDAEARGAGLVRGPADGNVLAEIE